MPRLTQVPASSLDQFRLRACHAVSGHFPMASAIDQIGNSTVAGPTTPEVPKYYGFGLFRVRSPLLSESLLFSFPPGTEMVHFPGFARTRLCIYRAVIRFCRIGFPHSEIPGSMPACGSPRLIAACHVLHRLLLPRHPPCALSSLTTKFTRHTREKLSAVSYQPSAKNNSRTRRLNSMGLVACSSRAKPPISGFRAPAG